MYVKAARFWLEMFVDVPWMSFVDDRVCVERMLEKRNPGKSPRIEGTRSLMRLGLRERRRILDASPGNFCIGRRSWLGVRTRTNGQRVVKVRRKARSPLFCDGDKKYRRPRRVWVGESLLVGMKT